MRARARGHDENLRPRENARERKKDLCARAIYATLFVARARSYLLAFAGIRPTIDRRAERIARETLLRLRFAGLENRGLRREK